MTMPPGVGKFVLTTHVVCSVGWIGAVVAYLALVVAALSSGDDATVRGAFVAMELTYFVLVPLALGALLTGVVQSLGTTWGLFRHYWVILKLVLTVLAAFVLLLNMQSVAALADAAASESGELPGAGGQLLHAGVGSLVLVVTMVLAIYKPRGMTRSGARRQRKLRDRVRDQRAERAPMAVGS